MVTPLAFYDLIETFPQPGCAVCRLLQRDVERFLSALLYEYVNEAETHRAFRDARGLCNQHGWQLTRFGGNSLGIAILHRAALDEVLKITERTPTGGRARTPGAPLADNLEPAKGCLACDLMTRSESDYLDVFAQSMGEARFTAGYAESSGLCLGHLRLLLRRPMNAAGLRHVLEIQRGLWTRLKAELALFEDRSGNDRRHEVMGDEADSWLRAIGVLGGEDGVFGQRRG